MKKVLLLSVPIAIQNLITSILNIFDQLMVGWLPTNADNCLSAVLLSNQIVFIFQIILFAASNTAIIFIAQYTESNNYKKIPPTMGFLLIVGGIICSICTLLCTAFPSLVISIFSPSVEYKALATEFLSVVGFSFIPMAFSVMLNFSMRGIRRMKLGLFSNVVAVVCNVILNYLFMFGGLGIPAMGFIGAAYGTILSRIIEFIIMIVGVIVLKYPLLASPKKMFCFTKKFVKKYFKMFFPILCNEIFWVLSGTVYLYVYDKLPDSEVVLAAMNIAQSVDKIVSVAMIGVGSAVGVVIGNTIGEHNGEKLRDYSKKSWWFSVAVGIFVGLLTFVGAFFVPSFFTEVSPLARHTSKILLFLFGITAVLRSISFMAVVGILRSGGDTTFCMLMETLLIWLVSVPLVFLFGLVFKWNIYALYALTNVSELLKCIVFTYRVKGDKWIKFKVDKSVPETQPAKQN